MHKTLYIDIDEEITSIIDRVRKAEAKEVIIVAPKNAMLLQSIVNLRLLKKEADRRKKQLLIITQDKVGKKLIEKAGILAQAKKGKDIYLNAEPDEETYEPLYSREAGEIKEELEKENENREIGSSDFFEKTAERPETGVVEKKDGASPLPPKSTKSGKKTGKSKVNMSDIVISKPHPKKKKAGKMDFPETVPGPELVVREGENDFSQSYAKSNAEPPRMSQVSIKKADKYFRGSRRAKKDFEIAKIDRGAKRYFIFFAGLFFLLAVLAAAWLSLPKATLALQLKNQEKSASLDLTADAQAKSANADEKTLPANQEQAVKEISEDFDATGTKTGGKKATGKAVIYNEFSTEDQPLVATTRLETGDGKIFRITENVVVPGVTKLGNETRPGAIEADVVADQPGESGNIGPSDFRISGFKDTPPKYEKFYAKSAGPMTGGAEGETKIVTAQDIASAKEKIAADAKRAAIENLKSNLAADRKIFESAVQTDVANISVSDAAGTEKEKFSATASAQASAISFSEADVKAILGAELTKSGAKAEEIAFQKPLNYILSESNIGQKMLKFQAKTDAKLAPDLDLENFKKGILGKSAADAQIYAKNFSAIEKMSISFWPFFVNRVPAREGRVEIEVR